MFWRRRQREQELERELSAHLELEAEEQRENYTYAPEARNAARRALGNTTLIREATREAWRFAWLDALAKDLRYGARSFGRSPAFATVAVLTASLGIGANTSIFSLVYAVLMHPLPYPHAERLVVPFNASKDAMMGTVVADFQYAAWRDQAGIWDGIAAYGGRRFTLTGMGDPEQLHADAVTPGFLRALQLTPLMGHDFSAADAEPRGGRVALISYGLWQRRFGGDPGILSRSMILDGKLYTVGGVLRREFEFPENTGADVLIALREPGPPEPNHAIYFYNVIARLKPNVTLKRATGELAVIDRRIASSFPPNLRSGADAAILPLHDRLIGNVRPALLVLSGAVALVLLIVCVNISNLLLARAIARQREMAVRIALGAGRARVARQLLTEGVLLAGAGGAGGLALAFGGVALLRAISPADVPHIANAHISGAVLAFNLALALASGILFGLAPLRGVSGIDPEAALKQTARSTTGSRGHRRMENLLIVAETAFALILLAGAGLLLRTFAGLTSIPPGFQPDNVVTAQISLPYWKYPTAQLRQEFWDGLIERVGANANSMGAVGCLPYGGFMMGGELQIQGHPAGNASDTHVVVNPIAGDYFRTLRIPLLEGRAVDSSDGGSRPPVVAINETLRRRFFPKGGAIGARIKVDGLIDWREIVGVVGDLKQNGLASEPRPEIFVSAAQFDNGSVQNLTIRTASDPRQLIPWLRARIAASDKDLPPANIETMRDKMASLVASQVFVMRLLALFAGVAITLAAMGVYSVLVYSVERRSHEIGIRLALGARRFAIVSLVMRRGLWLAICGSAIGIAGGLLLTRYLKSLLYGVTPHDPLTMASGSLLVVLVALIAAYFPARRAIGQDPITTLRSE
ncbi:MAG TPA: ABC transporter permease [Bryobacteraceae bacterium]|nr:ABC transporter permease [Bryobacteraceae bacterium]